ncbi:mannitol dehydrogenase family protein [Frondihabitans australicus]|uniref:Mannitol-1-phosphate 5-dehydrogenase n=1 Tax=Frondihabitans australicus TaxID=386892 RepID=A0A495IF50_9MICO|nr:mannitol dehydrogenase family protein [Frondihabitans australicus]RKR74389.1 mannitol 2-dehydrogenase [Frondihabitans australicus]
MASPAEQTTVPGPSYDRSTLTTGIVHFGLGNFHRAHQAMFLDRLMSEGEAHEWAICGVGVMPVDERMRDALTSQNFLYTLVLKHPDGSLEPRVIGSIHEYLYAPDDPEKVLQKLADPATKIVELTVTEGGYNIDRATGEFDLSSPAIVADLATDAVPATVFGLVVEGLRRRRVAGIPPFTVMSCDNIQGNGDTARATFTAYARAKHGELADWIESQVSFPNSMVDRITPVTTDADRALVAEQYGIDDAWPVMAEPFVQWVLEDDFTLGRPPYEKVGVQVVDDVEPYELMKLRLLNASHQTLAYFGYLSGHRYAHEAATDPLMVEIVKRYMDEEATPTLAPVPGIDLDAYKAELLVRFANPAIRDTLARLAQDASDRIPKWLVPVIRWNLAHDGRVGLSAAVVASWARYAEGVDEDGAPIEVSDNLASTLVPIARTYEEDHAGFVRNEQVFGDLAQHDGFLRPYLETLATLHGDGAQAALREALAR